MGAKTRAARRAAEEAEAADGLSRRQLTVGAGAPVKLHVYDALWLATGTQLPLVHLGVEVYGCEFSFGDAGVRSFKPGAYDPARKRDTVQLGYTTMRRKEVYSALIKMKHEFPGERYRLVGCNCQTFAVELVQRLGLGTCIPPHYTYFAKPWSFPAGVDLGDLVPRACCSNSSYGSSGSIVGSMDVELICVGDDLAIGQAGERRAPSAENRRSRTK